MLIHSVSGGRCAVALYHHWEQQATTVRAVLRGFKSDLYSKCNVVVFLIVENKHFIPGCSKSVRLLGFPLSTNQIYEVDFLLILIVAEIGLIISYKFCVIVSVYIYTVDLLYVHSSVQQTFSQRSDCSDSEFLSSMSQGYQVSLTTKTCRFLGK